MRSGDPSATWTLYAIDTTNDGTDGTPANPGCPCLGDQPLIGADAHGFYVSTNEFPFSGGFNGAQIYALPKAALVAGAAAQAQHFAGGPLAEGISYSVQPATVSTSRRKTRSVRRSSGHTPAAKPPSSMSASTRRPIPRRCPSTTNSAPGTPKAPSKRKG